MKRVTGIGGIFFHAADAPALREWYRKHLGIDVQEWGGAVFTETADGGGAGADSTIWNIQSDSFAPGRTPFMINYRVADLDALLHTLRAEGCDVLGDTQVSEFGKFGWVVDPEGNKVELWEPPAGQ